MPKREPLSDQPGSRKHRGTGSHGLAGYLEQIKSAILKKDWVEAKRHGEIAVKKLPRLSYTPQEEHSLYCRIGMVYFQLTELSGSLDNFYKAYAVALKNKMHSAYIAYAVQQIGFCLSAIRNMNQALKRFDEVEQYYKKYGNDFHPMGEFQHLYNLVGLGYCYLYHKNYEKVKELVEDYLPLSRMVASEEMLSAEYQHLKGEYFIQTRDYIKGREAFQEAIKSAGDMELSKWVLESQIHIAQIDALENKLSNAIWLLNNILKNARRLKLNDLICEASLFLSRCYSLSKMPEKAEEIEKRIRPSLNKLNTIWFYEKTREFESFFRQLESSKTTGEYACQPLVDILTHRYEASPNKQIIIGTSTAMQEVYNLIEKTAPTDLPVLIQGETGTGKELIANAIHSHSHRTNKTYLPFNCGVLPETLIETTLFGHTKGAFTDAKEDKKGYIELASGGTLFIDEIANMSPSMQQKLLRVMEEKLVWRLGAQKPIPVNTRFIFASNQPIEQLVGSKLFREDLFYRINTIVINLPPLRERKGDIPLLIRHFLRKYAPVLIHNRKPVSHRGIPDQSRFYRETKWGGVINDLPEISSSALQFLTAYSWPGNIRELENEIKRICVLYPETKTITETMLLETIQNYSRKALMLGSGKTNLKDLMGNSEKDIIKEALAKSQGNVTKAARLLGCSRVGLHKKIRRLKITIPDVTSR
ncbi:MAG: sigma-54-dependent Fis family transcriptional regulator [Planctomycetes bacterium]|nr:sigma-54-dependent Fis family transcriptional regulator [Planctomycetota bacterium]